MTDSTGGIPTDAWTEIEAISDQVRRALECPVCLMLSPDMACPYVACQNGHTACRSCLHELWNSNSTHHCPTCRSPMDTSTLSMATVILLTEVLATVRLACTYREFGCNQMYYVRDVPDHERTCVYKPNTYCLVAACQWVGTYDQLHEHVGCMHPDVYIKKTTNILSVDNIKLIESNRRRTLLVLSSVGMFWVVLSRKSRFQLLAGMFIVENSRPPETVTEPNMAFTEEPETPGPVTESTQTYSYQLRWFDEKGRSRFRSKMTWVGSSSLLSEEIRGGNRDASDSYTLIKSRSGSVEFRWFP
ncbi:TRAF-like,Zinc finger, RING-type,Zinc finger, RING/FYVE/PHD-type,Zinc finger, SIAH-type,Seven-in- [Cinara cedri]|uniref:TRAF-like,Zinc finger, RING-type,Zinc finger, RING/FYVE/PHD-type,Zinc finger, SIAH-type,Seven-in n=1 Tax=Cinara cedri TaxID=506608 RepID=A0A5E4N4L6_9HEMI|nr:TRAF-like,Zinc finger, RING-type,Zinc finger, RING/FYVE/PHD-type,Zinc finger, SIAH-type,Seven-in- [Cinara cedri]